MKSEAVQVKKLDRIVLIQTRIPGMSFISTNKSLIYESKET